MWTGFICLRIGTSNVMSFRVPQCIWLAEKLLAYQEVLRHVELVYYEKWRHTCPIYSSVVHTTRRRRGVEVQHHTFLLSTRHRRDWVSFMVYWAGWVDTKVGLQTVSAGNRSVSRCWLNSSDTCGECSCLADRVPPGGAGPRATQYVPPKPGKILQIKPKSTSAICTFNFATLRAPSRLFIYLSAFYLLCGILAKVNHLIIQHVRTFLVLFYFCYILCFFGARSQNCEKRPLASSCPFVRPHGTIRIPLDGYARRRDRQVVSKSW